MQPPNCSRLLGPNQFFQNGLVPNGERGTLQHRDLALTEISQNASYGFSRGANDLGDLSVGQRQLHLRLRLIRARGCPFQQ